MQVKKQQLELDMEQQISSKSRKEFVKAVYCHPAYLNLYIRILVKNKVKFSFTKYIKVLRFFFFA